MLSVAQLSNGNISGSSPNLLLKALRARPNPFHPQKRFSYASSSPLPNLEIHFLTLARPNLTKFFAKIRAVKFCLHPKHTKFWSKIGIRNGLQILTQSHSNHFNRSPFYPSPQLPLSEMPSPDLHLNEFPHSPQSTSLNEAGLEDFDATASSFIETNNFTVNVPEHADDEARNNPEFIAGVETLPLETQGRSKELNGLEREQAYACLLERMQLNGVLKKGSTRVVAAMFGVSIRTIQRLWKRARDSGNHGHQSLRARNCGRKRIEFDMERLRDIPLGQRTTIRGVAFALGVSKQFVCAKLKEGVIRRHTNAVKPLLTQENKTSRIKHCLSSIDPNTVPHCPTFKHMENTVHIDEKWFWLSKKSQRYYLLRDENDPVRFIKNSNFIPKVMFLAAVARPRYDSNGRCVFDGKIGVFPLVQSVAAVRSSQNRPRGTMEIKPIANITRNVIRSFMVEKVLPAIANKWPRESILDPIYIQQDNARSHINFDDVEFLCAAQSCGLNVSLVCQPPNSPDLNVLDLGFFRAIQSLQSKECARSLVQLIGAVEDAFLNFPVKNCNYIFLTLQTCMVEVLKCDGSNTYKIPHIKKESLARLGNLPTNIGCCPEVFANAFGLTSE